MNCDRLRFLADAPSEAVHRTNLAIADVVLDTFPYKGATTTSEFFWKQVVRKSAQMGNLNLEVTNDSGSYLKE